MGLLRAATGGGGVGGVLQTAFGEAALCDQLVALGLRRLTAARSLQGEPSLDREFRNLWTDNADALANPNDIVLFRGQLPNRQQPTDHSIVELDPGSTLQ